MGGMPQGIAQGGGIMGMPGGMKGGAGGQPAPGPGPAPSCSRSRCLSRWRSFRRFDRTWPDLDPEEAESSERDLLAPDERDEDLALDLPCPLVLA
mmetsp:Transcript_40359/g.90449  ORF Transcript_40359/g.90449 Transcript_40359/m.90449 type:complete len:95 (-) Transcript_40359:455-739(-)